ncbi:UNVERIFIED_CONTAM: putative DCC family thiol-disulfide oxidoreductase YuxK [Brevibacillus sp. OAP136]
MLATALYTTLESWAARGLSVVLFDGDCLFCNRWVRLIMERDKEGRFRFAPLQSPLGQSVIQHFFLPGQAPDSVLLVESSYCYSHSDAVLKICRRLGGSWRALSFLWIVPRSIRDVGYRWFAHRRHAFAGKKAADECPLLPEELRSRFLYDKEE